MSLTVAQMAVVKSDVLANNDLNTQPHTADGFFEIARLYNLPPAVQQLVWRTEAPVSAIFDAITWANFTPNDVADVTALYTNRVLLIQTKQMNLQNMLVGRLTLDASKLNIRVGLRDAVIQLPAGTAGALVSAGGAGGVTVLTACTRNATRIEKLLSSTVAAIGGVTANLLGFEGNVSDGDIAQVLAN